MKPIKQNYIYFIFFIVLLSIINCSPKHNNLVNRNLHALSTKYNVVFNGEQALEAELKNINEKYHDNFFDLLAVEKFKVEDEVFLPGQVKNSKLDKAEEKAVKAIQKHSMNTDGEEHNRKIDEAYMLLGKSRYYQKRFLAAIDAFNYVVYNDFKSNLRKDFKLWREKTNIRLNNNEEAIRELKDLIRKKDTPKNIVSEAKAYIGQAYINTDSLNRAAEFLGQAAVLSNSKEKRARYFFIAAQLLDKTNRKDSAIGFLKQIEDLNKPLKYAIQAELYRYHLSLDKKDLHSEMLDKLNKYLGKYEYHKYYPYINYEIGEIFHSEDSLKRAVQYYTEAARHQDKRLQEEAYGKMADIGFHKKNYLMAGNYLDSLLQVMSKKTLKYLKTKHKRNNIDEVVQLEKTIKTNDSLMKMVQMDSLGRVKAIQAYIEKLKEKEEENEKNEAGIASTKTKYTSFYFYNESLVSKGKNIFKKRWGEINLTDMWRLKDKKNYEDIDDGEEIGDKEVSEEDVEKNLPKKYRVSYYYAQIPTARKDVDSIAAETNRAHYQVGMIYFEKFKENTKAGEHLEKMLAEHPDEKLVPPAKYYLHKLYKEQGKTQLAEKLSNEILKTYPDSVFADLIRNPGKVSGKSNKEFQEDYKNIYTLFDAQEYIRLLEQAEVFENKFRFHPELAKIELLKAASIGRLKGLDAYEKALREIILKYPGTAYANAAKQRMGLVNKYKSVKYKKNPKDTYKLVVLTASESQNIENSKSCMEQIKTKTNSAGLDLTVDLFTEHQSFVVLHNFISNESATYLKELFASTTCTANEYFVISSNNYKILQLTKNIKAYKEFLAGVSEDEKKILNEKSSGKQSEKKEEKKEMPKKGSRGSQKKEKDGDPAKMNPGSRPDQDTPMPPNPGKKQVIEKLK